MRATKCPKCGVNVFGFSGSTCPGCGGALAEVQKKAKKVKVPKFHFGDRDDESSRHIHDRPGSSQELTA